MKKTEEETLKGCHISVNRLWEERPMLVHNIIRSMHRFAQQSVEQWIDVNERLPEIGAVVLVYCSIKSWTKNRIFVSDYTLYGFESYVGVTYWQPLPQPPIENQLRKETCK